MKKMNLLHDYLCSRMIAERKKLDSSEYGQLYFKTNEDLVDAYLDTEFREKDVFSVLASSDQVFTARLLEAKKVDAFDRNRLTLYYFYLRLWTLKYNKELYPRVLYRDANQWLRELLKKVKPENEVENQALIFFRKHQQVHTHLSNLFLDEYLQENGSTLYQKPEELEDCLSSDLEFTSFDFFQPQEFDKDYDIVLMSNILDFAKGKDIETARDNLRKLTRKDASVICSNLVYQTPQKKKQQEEIFSPYFEREEKPYSYIYHRK